MNLFEAISQAVADEATTNSLMAFGDLGAAPAARRMATPGAASTKPILQLDAFPVTINPDEYKNPHSTANPDGSFASLWAFRQLVDPVPMFSRYYSPSGRSTESTYSLVANSASIGRNNPFATEVIAQSQQKLSQIRYANMDGTAGSWAPIYATPSDWYETAGDRYKTIDFDLSKAGDPNSPFALLAGGSSPLGLKVCSHSPDVVTPLDPDTHVKQITLKYLRVTLNRPWFTELIFNTNGWFLSGQPAGFCSSGNLQVNEGTLPLLPTSILFATDVTIDAEWGARNQKTIDDAHTKGNQVSLDHLVIYPASDQTQLQVLGWITSLVPFSPMEAQSSK